MPIPTGPRLAKKVLLIGWDAADWKVITPLLDAGKMPALETLVDRGVMGNLATLDPPFSPMLWTSIATGKTADQHGIHGFVEPRPDGTGVRPVLGTSRRGKALWNILQQNGLRSNVVGWWPSHPAEPIGGAMVSNFYQRARAPISTEWAMAPGTVHPPELADTLAALRVHPAELTGALLAPFLGAPAQIDPATDKRLASLARIVADAASIQSAATYLMEHTTWDFMAVYFDAIDHFGHGFMKYHPPRMPSIPEADFAQYRGVVEAGYRFHDMLLDRLLDLAGDDTLVLLVSDHGFHSDHLRPTRIPSIPAGPAVEHRSFGIVVMAGPGIRADERVNGAGLLDIAPTVLTGFGLPVGRDMPGRPLVECWAEPPVVTRIDSWERVPGEAGLHPPDTTPDPWLEREALDHLVALGYVDPLPDDQRTLLDRTRAETRLNLARVYLAQRKHAEALPLLQAGFEPNAPHRIYAGTWLLQAYVDTNRVGDARAVLDTLRGLYDEGVEGPPAPALDLLEGRLLLREGLPEAALSCFRALLDRAPSNTTVLLLLGRALVRQEAYAEALTTFARVLDLDPDNARALHGRAQAFIGLKQYEEACTAAYEAVARFYNYPEAHFHLGVALARLGHASRSLEAFQVCLAQAPGMAAAHRWP
ncbi:MAG: alkaline phosphatase family protein [Bacteroidota bacterium]